MPVSNPEARVGHLKLLLTEQVSRDRQYVIRDPEARCDRSLSSEP